MSLLLIKIKEALQDDSIIVTDETRTLVKAWLANQKHLSNLRAKAEEEVQSSAFIKITPRKLDNTKLFGSITRSTFAQEVAIYPAVHNGEEWVQGETAFLKGLITERGLSNMMFNHQRYAGEYFTFTEHNGVPVAPASQFFGMNERYSKLTNEDAKRAIEALEALIEMTKTLQDPEVKLNKKLRETMQEELQKINMGGSMEFALELTREKLEEDSIKMRAEVVSSLTGILHNIAKPLLENKSAACKAESLIQSYYEHANELTPENDAVRKLLGAYKHRMSPEDVKALSRFTEVNKERLLARAHSELAKGSAKMSMPSGTPSYMFGNTVQVNHYAQMQFSFATERLNEYGEVNIVENQEFLTVILTHNQLTELMQGSLGEASTKCTLTRYVGAKVSNPDQNLEHDPFAIDISKRYNKNEALDKALLTLSTLLSSTSQAKAHKAKVMEAAQSIEGLLLKETEARREQFETEANEIIEKFQAHHANEVTNMINTVEASNPQLSSIIMKLLK
ncbi:hypothetical protein VCHA53O466_50143 [Vibrio chagasii]|nr:hypothetical protein VCHA53O466_50143 [Vibrio chagasii]